MYKALVKANDARLLNTKQQIQYEEGKIVGVRGLKLIREEGVTTFKIETTRPTKKRDKEEKEEDKEKDKEKN